MENGKIKKSMVKAYIHGMMEENIKVNLKIILYLIFIGQFKENKRHGNGIMFYLVRIN